MKYWLIFLFIISCGCVYHNELPISQYKSRHNLELRGEFTELQVKNLDKILDALPQKVLKSVKSLSINNSPDHYENEFITAGHCNERRICIKSQNINKEGVLYHEIAHAYTNYLSDNGSSFARDWFNAAGFPPRGILNIYSLKNYREDIAEWVKEFYLAILDKPTIFSLPKIEYLQYSENYRAKLDLLLKYGFINETNYEKFLNRFRPFRNPS